MKRDERVILVHGLWFGAWAMGRLAGRLCAANFVPLRFRYATHSANLCGHARRLNEFCLKRRGEGLHFVAHSLGGLVVLSMLSRFASLPPGRVVLLGSPLAGSAVARKVGKIRLSRGLFGRIGPSLEAGYADFPDGWEVGMIAGSRGIGLGLLVGGAGGPNDGTVAVAETQNRQLRDHLVLPVTHTGMLYSREVARQIVLFLSSGRFKNPGRSI
ncbi:MAG: alpha/beta hydrolase [Xanthomonadales bacterium]|nr:alpha/beta hydrolase [Xanthomonadales bacterium]